MIFGAFIVLSVAVSGLHVPLLGIAVDLAWIGCSVAWIYYAMRYNATTWVMLTAQWQSSFLCHRCSHVFLSTQGA